MRYWNVSDRETPELRRLGLVGIPVTVAGITIQPGADEDIPVHAIAEIQGWVRRGVLSTSPVPRQIPEIPSIPQPTVPDLVAEKPVQTIDPPADESAPKAPEPTSSATDGSRKRRG